MNNLEILERDMYSEAEAARLLNVAQSTLHYWLDGGSRRGRTYQPVVRTHPTGQRRVTWAEFVEAGLLREYRQGHGIPMAELRLFIESLRSKLDVPYPLAHLRPFTSGKRLFYEAQSAAGLTGEFCLVAVAGDQLLLTPAAESFMRRVTWVDDVAMGWRPAADPDSTVRISPDVRFGKPSVGGISTEVLWEHSEAGESAADLANTFEVDINDVRWALSYENTRQLVG